MVDNNLGSVRLAGLKALDPHRFIQTTLRLHRLSDIAAVDLTSNV